MIALGFFLFINGLVGWVGTVSQSVWLIRLVRPAIFNILCDIRWILNLGMSKATTNMKAFAMLSCHFLFIETNSVPWRFGSLHLGRNRWHHHPQHRSNSGQLLFVSVSIYYLCKPFFLVSGTSNFPLFFLNFTFNNNRRQQTVDVVEHGWLELNQGTRNMIQLSVSDLVYWFNPTQLTCSVCNQEIL